MELPQGHELRGKLDTMKGDLEKLLDESLGTEFFNHSYFEHVGVKIF